MWKQSNVCECVHLHVTFGVNEVSLTGDAFLDLGADPNRPRPCNH